MKPIVLLIILSLFMATPSFAHLSDETVAMAAEDKGGEKDGEKPVVIIKGKGGKVVKVKKPTGDDKK